MIKVATPMVNEEEVNAVREVLLSGNYTSGAKVEEFESRFAEFIGTRFAVAVNSGTAALHICLAALEIGAGDEVIVPSLTFFATVSCVLHQNATPVFADIDPASYCLDIHDVRSKITERTKAIIPVHLFGQAADMHPLLGMANDKNIAVIEDCAQAHGTEYHGKVVGSLGRAGAFSFFATKHMTTGEGGMITTDDGHLARQARQIRNHGMRDRDTHVVLGYNYRMNEIAAAIGLVQLKKLPWLNKARIRNSFLIIESLENLEWLQAPKLLPYIKHTFFWVPFYVNEDLLGMSTGNLIKKLYENGIEVRHRYPAPLYKQPVLHDREGFENQLATLKRRYDKLYLPNVEKVAGKLIGLPNHAGLRSQDLYAIVDVLEKL